MDEKNLSNRREVHPARKRGTFRFLNQDAFIKSAWTAVGLSILLLVHHHMFFAQNETVPQTVITHDLIYPPWDPTHYCGTPQPGACNLNLPDRGLRHWMPDPLFPAFNHLLFLAGLLLMSGPRRSGWIGPILCGSVLLYNPVFNNSGSAIWLTPFILFLSDKTLQRKTTTPFAALALSFAWQLLRAEAEITLITLLLIAFYAGQALPRMARSKRRRALLTLLAALGAGAALASMQWLPRLAASADLYLPAPEPAKACPPLALLSLFHPSLAAGLARGHAASLYSGVIVLFLAGAAVLRDNRAEIRWHLALYALALVFLFLAARFLNAAQIVMAWSLARLAGIGLAGLERRRPVEGFSRIRTYGVILLILLTGVLMFLLFAPEVLTAVSAHLGDLNQRRHFYESALIDSWIGIAALLFALLLLKAKTKSGLIAPLYLIMAVAELWLTGCQQSAAAEEKFPSFDTGTSDQRIYPIGLRVSGQSILGTGGARLRLYQDLLQETGFDLNPGNPFVDKYWRLGVHEGEIVPLMMPAPNLPVERRHFENAVLDLLNVRTVISADWPINDPHFQLIEEKAPWIYENRGALPRVFFVDSVIVLSGTQRIYRQMQCQDFDPRCVALLEEEPPFRLAAAGSRRASILSFTPHRILIEAVNEGEAILVTSELHYPRGWAVSVDGKRSKSYKANALLRALFLAPGRHQIEFRYTPPLYLTGVLVTSITILSLLALIMTGAVIRWRDRWMER